MKSDNNKSKKIISSALATSMLSAGLFGVPTNIEAAGVQAPKDLSDIKSQAAKDALMSLYEQGKIGGYSDGTFRPNKTVSRAEFMAMILRALDIKDTDVPSTNVKFKDSKEGNWHYELLKKSYALGLMSGSVTSNGEIEMKPNEIINRQEMLLILVRAYEKQLGEIQITDSEVTSILSKYLDKNRIPNWAKKGVAKAIKGDITTGKTENVLGILDSGNRLESAMFAYRLLNAEGDGGDTNPPTNPNPPVADVIKPTITLKGSSSITLKLGEAYVEAGVTATDNLDGDISSKVVISGTVDVNKVGEYTIKYNVQDNAKNDAVEVTRVVKVVDDVKPAITLKGSSSITLKLGEAYIEPGVTATDNADGDISSKVVTSGTVDVNKVGEYIIKYNVQDDSKNTADEVTRVVKVIDDAKPVMTLNGSPTEYIDTNSSYVDGGVNVTDNYDTNLVSSVVVTGTVDTTKAGTYQIVYNVQDSSGNVAAPLTRTVIVSDGDIVYVESVEKKVEEVIPQLASRFGKTVDRVHFIKSQPTDDGGGTPTYYKVKDFTASDLVVAVNYGPKANPGDPYPYKDLYSIIVDDEATTISVDINAKTIKAKSTDELRVIKTAFETNASSVLGSNQVEFFVKRAPQEVVKGNMRVLVENSNRRVEKDLVKFRFADSLTVSSANDSIVVTGLKFEDLLDFYVWDETTSAWIKDNSKSNVEVKVDGTYTFSDLNFGKYKIIKHPVELGIAGESKYDTEYNNRLINENIQEVKPRFTLLENEYVAFRIDNNYSSFGFDSTDPLADFVKEEMEVAQITDSGKLFAEIVYNERTERVNFKKATVTFGTEAVDHDRDAGTPNINYQTVKLNILGDFAEFALGEKVDFKLILTDKANKTAEAKTKVEISMRAEAVLDSATGSMKVKLSTIK